MLDRRALSIVFLLMLLSACSNPLNKKTDWTVSLDKNDKKPYGSYLAFHSLKYFFPQSKISELSAGFRYSNIDNSMIYNAEGTSLFIALGLDLYLSQNELDQLVSFAEEGNEVLLFSRVLDEKLETLLKCAIQNNGLEERPLTRQNNGSGNLNTLTLASIPGLYGYQGRSLAASFKVLEEDTVDSIEPTVVSSEDEEETRIFYLSDTLGYVKKSPDILRYAVGKGHITLHAAPLVMSNYFLLQNSNREYLEGIWQTFPSNITRIYWNNYFKRTTDASDLGILLKYPATRWAFILAVFALLMYILFEGKRKQRIIPVIALLENSSVSFVETVGRLYYNKADHTNLGEKMIQHFLEWVRAHYFINTNKLDEHFKEQLILKSGLPESVIVSLMEMIREIHLERKAISEQELYHLHQTIQQFYKSNKP